MQQTSIQAYRLSHQQRQLWLADRESAVSRARCVVRIEGVLDRLSLRRAVSRVVGRHQALRTAFSRRPGIAVPVQVVGSARPPRWRDVDLASLPAPRQAESVRQVLETFASAPFDLAAAPLLRTALLRLSPGEHRLLLELPSLCADVRSLANLYLEIARAYEGSRRGEEPAAEALPYVQFSEWQYELFEDEERAGAGKAYWDKQHRAAGPAAKLPMERRRSPASQSHRRHTLSRRIDTPVTTRGELAARRAGGSLETFLLTCWKVLLWRLRPLPETTVVTVGDGRRFEELEEVVGLLARPLPVTTRLVGRQPFESLLKAVGRATREAFKWQEYCLLPERAETAAGGDPFAYGFEAERRPAPRRFAGTCFTLLCRSADVDPSRLKLCCASGEPSADEPTLVAELAYDPASFDRQDARRLLSQFHTLAASAARHPSRAVERLDVLSGQERRQLLVAFNDAGTPTPRPSGVLIHRLFEARVEQAPERIAVRCEARKLTRAELNARANRLARFLRRRGIGPEGTVVLCLERSLEMVVALLATLKTGGAFVPVAPAQPEQRLASILGGMAAPLVLTASRQQGNLPANSRRVCLDADGPEIARHSAENLSDEALPGNLAYVIFTSGSTGSPKGVMVEHRQLLHYVTAVRERLDFPPDAGFAMVSTFAADLGHTMLFPALTSGGTLHVVSQERAGDAAALAEYFRRHGIDCLKIVPSHFEALMDRARPRRLLPRRHLVFGGEALSPALVGEIAAAKPEIRIFNHYGPTETTVGVMVHRVDPGSVDARCRSLPLGTPLAGTRICVLDPRLEPVAAWIAGEISISGAGLARGYLARPGPTAERFIPDPLTGAPGERLYRTGDLARHAAAGAVEFLGRTDHQVKFHGVRVELGEVRAALNRHQGLRDSIVRVARAQGGHQVLVAYYTGGEELPAAELRHWLGARLPEEVIPNVFVALPAFPLTPNGKVDVAALPTLEQVREKQEKAFIAPRDATEERLAAIWAEVLGTERVGIHDDFFELGGDSLLSIRIIALADRAGLRLTPAQLFDHPTVAELAALAGTAAKVRAEQDLVTGAVPLTPIQHRFFEQDVAARHHWNLPFELEFTEAVDGAKLAAAVRELLVHHDALRLRFSRGEDGWRQSGAGFDGRVPFSWLDLSRLAPPRQDRALAAASGELQSSLDLGRAPLLAAAFVTGGAGRPDRMLMIVHHLVVDGVSWPILLEDLQAAYRSLARGEKVELAPKTSSFKSWALRLTEAARSPSCREELSYWSAQPWERVEPLPLDARWGENSEGSAENLVVALERDATRALSEDVPALLRARIDEVLLTALAEAFAAWTGRRSLLVDVEGHGRDESLVELDLSRTVGWFTSVAPLVLELPASADPRASLQAVKERFRAVPRRGIGYALLRYLSDEAEVRDELRGRPRAQVGFNHLGRLERLVPEPAMFRATLGCPGALRDPRARRLHLFSINSFLSGGRLRVYWTYSRNLHRRETVETLAASFLDALRKLVAPARERPADAAARFDFPAAGLSRQERRRVADLLEGGGGPVEDVYPLAPVQEGMLFHSLLRPGADVYFRQLSCLITGAPDVRAFRQAWGLAVERHSILRTAFLWQGLDRALQVVRRRLEVPFEEQDWRGLEASEQRRRLDAWLEADRERGFDLARAPLLRLALFRVAEGSCRFVWSFHHLLLDGASRVLLLREVFALYEALGRGREPALPAPLPFREYVDWIRRQDPAAAERFWRRELAGFTAPTPVAVHAAAAGSTGGVFAHKSVLARPLTRALESLARRHQLTPSTVVHGAWALLLSRHSGEDDVVFGSISMGRSAPLPEVGSRLGLLIHTLALRARVRPGAPLVRWLRQLQRHLVEVRRYEYASPAQVQSWSEVPPGRPLFESLVVFQGLSASDLGTGALSIRELGMVREVSNYPLSLNALPASELALEIVSHRARFDATSAGRLSGHLRSLLAAMAAEPESRLADLPLLGPAQRFQLLVEWNDTARPVAGGRDLPRLFEARAGEHPDRSALVWQDQVISYRQLNRRANRQGHRLRELGVGPEALVGISTERSPDMVAGVLAVLKAGGVFVPLDPSYPRERLRFMMDDAGIEVLLTQRNVAEALPEHGARTLCLDAGGAWLDAGRSENLDVPVAGSGLAYVIYTSGSTGRPKGVGLTHSGLLNLAVAQGLLFGLGGADRVLQFSSLSFDAAVWEMAMALAPGATLVLGKAGELIPGPDLRALVCRQRINVATLPPSALAAMGEGELESLAVLVVAGEACGPDLVDRWGHGRRFWNAYGPSEGTVCATAQRCRPGGGPPAIGRPLANTVRHVVDGRFHPLPVGIPGELAIGGAGLARGYLRRPALTAEKFVPDPWSARAGARLYRTGDLVRCLGAGEVFFLGRVDHQVKVRGFRIELGEIEATISGFDAVRDVAVVARDEAVGERRLLAYVVADPEAGVDGGEIRARLEQKLPGHMVPAFFVFLERLPQTPNGKVDRAALARRALPERPSAAGEAYRAPRTPLEGALAVIYAEVLRAERVGLDDDFFTLGGHSLMATRIAWRIRDAFDVEIALSTVFETPKLADLAEIIGRLGALGSEPLPPIEAAVRPEAGAASPMALSFAQRRLWFLHRLEPESVAYNVPAAARLEGRLDVAAFAAALSEIVRRHEILRTVFEEVEGRPVQVSAPHRPVRPASVDLRSLAPAPRSSELRRLARREARRPFDLVHGPLLRATLLVLGPGEHAILLNLHHIVSDAWSIDVLLRELETLYEAVSKGSRVSPLPELEIQYADFARWQRQWLTGGVLEAHLAYWRERLRGAAPGSGPPVLELPADRPRPAVQTYGGADLPLRLSPRLPAALEALGRRHSATLFMTLLAAFQVLMSRYTGQTDVTLGAPIAGRTQRQTANLIGFFVNTLVLRTSLAGAPAFAELVRRVRETTLGAYAHQDLPFEKLVDELGARRDPSHTPLFQVVFSLRQGGRGLRLPGLSTKPLEVRTGTAKFDLALLVSEDADGLSGSVVYRADLFDAATVGRLAGHFETLLHGLTADPERRFTELEILRGEERHQLLLAWNDTGTQEGREALAHQLFEARARERPDRVAVAGERRWLSYGELDRRASRLARRLRSLGIRPEATVGLCLERSPEQVTAVLAVAKAGGAYVSLDPSPPRERLRFMLEDSGARVLVRSGPATAPGCRGVEVVLADSSAAAREESPAGAPAPENLAYVIYTSGSTGRPKGVALCHGGLLNLLRWHQDRYGVTAADRATQLSGLSFDASVWELWPYLTAGASLHIPDEETRTAPAGLVSWLAARAVTLSFLPTPLAEAVLAEPWPPATALRALLTGGDRLRRRPGRDAPFAVVNHYGPTEDTVVATTAPVEPAGGGDPAPPAIGRPLAGQQAYVADRRGRAVAVGIPGELLLGGRSLARGYLDRPGLTAGRFVPDAFGAGPGARLYRTGDRVRCRGDGEIEFLGRFDHQVKLRGFRIELGEIEALLATWERLRESAVVPRRDPAGELRLVAWVVPEPPPPDDAVPDDAVPGAVRAPTLAELRAFAGDKLPEYMIPTALVVLDELPQNANGKIDRAALGRRTLPVSAFSGERHRRAPRTPTQEILAGIYSEVLGVEGVGSGDDFFELGGHSLQATQVVSRIRAALGVEVALRSLFEAPAPAGLAARIDAARRAARGPAAPAIERFERSGEVPASFAQERLWFAEQMEPATGAYNLPMRLQMEGPLDAALLARALREILRRHEALRTGFTAVDGRPVQTLRRRASLRQPLVDLGALPEAARSAEARRWLSEQAWRPFDLACPPLLRVVLLRLGPARHVLLVTVHHLVFDGWSMGVFLRELSRLYRDFSTTGVSSLPELPVQYADFAHWQRRRLEGEVLESQLEYWRRQLAGAPPVLELPADRPRPAVRSLRGGSFSRRLPAHLADALDQLSRRRGVTLFMTLLAAFKTLLHRYTAATDVVVGTDVANRNRREIEDLIGFFVNHPVLRTDLSGDPSFAELLDRVRKVTLEAYDHQDVPFERLVEELAPRRDLSHAPLFQVLFVLQNMPSPELELPGLSVGPLDLGEARSKFDLVVIVEEIDGVLYQVWTYSRDLFDEATVLRMSGHFETLLHEVVTRPEARLSDLEISTEEEKDRRRAERRQLEVKTFRAVRRKAVDLSPAAPGTERSKGG